LTRTVKGSCRALGRKGFQYSCKKAPWWRASGLGRWSLTLGRGMKLQRGTYRLRASAGAASDTAVFRIR
jgi:hypothetical protein